MGETTTTLAVGGMTCGGCAGNVQRALEGVAGVTSAAVDHVAGNASVMHAGVTQAELEAAVAAHLHTLLRYSDYTSANIRIFGQVPRTSQNRNRAIRRTYAEYWNGLLQYAKDRGEIGPDADLSLVRLFLLGSVNWSVEWYDPKKKSTEFLAKKFCNILFEGIGS